MERNHLGKLRKLKLLLQLSITPNAAERWADCPRFEEHIQLFELEVKNYQDLYSATFQGICTRSCQEIIFKHVFSSAFLSSLRSFKIYLKLIAYH